MLEAFERSQSPSELVGTPTQAIKLRKQNAQALQDNQDHKKRVQHKNSILSNGWEISSWSQRFHRPEQSDHLVVKEPAKQLDSVAGGFSSQSNYTYLHITYSYSLRWVE